MTQITNKTVLITGGTGSFGKTMLQELLHDQVGEVRVFSRDEEKQDALRHQLKDERVRYYVGDIRDKRSVDHAMKGVDMVFHAAALKQVPSCEFFPMQAVHTNIMGSANVIDSAVEHEVQSVVCLSTDKAVMPVNAMGMSKAMMEKVAQSVARHIGKDAPTTLSCVRYGNVLFSRGSVLPLFIKQMQEKQPLTLTNPEMTRFLMPLRDSVALVKYAFTHANQGDIFIKKAPASTISTLAEAMMQLFNYSRDIQTIGTRHGEKLYETLASAAELAQAKDHGEYYQIAMDGRHLNYTNYTTSGNASAQIEDYHSHNTTRLDVEATIALLKTLPEIQALL